MPDCPAVFTVRELRRRWKPHKESLQAVQEHHPTAVRLHRAFSWLARVEQVPDAAADHDVVLICRWIAFNALYGRWDTEAQEPVADQLDGRVRVCSNLVTDARMRPSTLCENRRRAWPVDSRFQITNESAAAPSAIATLVARPSAKAISKQAVVSPATHKNAISQGGNSSSSCEDDSGASARNAFRQTGHRTRFPASPSSNSRPVWHEGHAIARVSVSCDATIDPPAE
jgi:hypothetical protein